MRHLTRILEHVNERPWLITPAGHRAIQEVLRHALEEKVPAQLWDGDPTGTEGTGYVIDRLGLAQIEVSGTLGNRLSMVEKICGGVDYQELTQSVTNAVEDGARGLLLQIDSPGGMANGAGELAEVIANLPVPKVVYTDSLCASAAYYLAASADLILASPTALVGSIGVLLPWVDQSGALAKAGLRFDPVVSRHSELKTAGGGPSLSFEQRAYFQAQTDQLYESFTGFIERYRSIDFPSLAGGVYFGPPAVVANLVDGLGTYGDAYNALARLVDNRAGD